MGCCDFEKPKYSEINEVTRLCGAAISPIYRGWSALYTEGGDAVQETL